MNDMTAGADTPAADGAQPEAIAVTSDPATEQPAAVEGDASAEAEQTGDTGDDEAAKPRKKPGVHNRIDELTRQKHDAIRDRDYWKGQFEKLSSADTEAMDFDDQIVTKVQRASAKERADAADMTAQKAIAEQFSTLEAEARDKWADYDAVTRNPTLPMTTEMVDLIAESELGPDVAYHLGKNPTEARRLAGMSGPALAREIGRLEARLTAPKATPKIPAAPIKPVTGLSAGGSKDPTGMSMAEYAAWRKSGNG